MEKQSAEAQDGQRWRRLVSAFLVEVPELSGLLARREVEEPITLGDVWTTISLELLSDDYAPLQTESELWARLLRLLEVVEELRDFLEQTVPHSQEDVVMLDAFANAGLVCDITRNRAGLERLLPSMGPRTIQAVRGEVAVHDRVHREWGGRDVAWESAGAAFRRADVDPAGLRPQPVAD